jgi:hypothetical protein
VSIGLCAVGSIDTTRERATNRLFTGAFMTINKLSALIVLVFAGCNSFASAEQMRWIEYRPAGEGFRVEMPENPEIVSNELNSKFGPLKQIVAKVELVDRWFAVAYLDVPEEKSGSAANDVETQLDGGRDGAVRGMTTDGNKATLRSEKRMSVSGYPAREIIVDIPALKIVTVMRLLVVKKRMFSLGFTSFAGSEGKSDVNRFLDSFVVLQSQ